MELQERLSVLEVQVKHNAHNIESTKLLVESIRDLFQDMKLSLEEIKYQTRVANSTMQEIEGRSKKNASTIDRHSQIITRVMIILGTISILVQSDFKIGAILQWLKACNLIDRR